MHAQTKDEKGKEGKLRGRERCEGREGRETLRGEPRVLRRKERGRSDERG